jgi:hypothetical protein
MSPRTSALPDSTAPLAMRTRSRMPHVSTDGDLPVNSRRRRLPQEPVPIADVPFTKKGPPVGHKKSTLPTVSAVGESVSDGQHNGGHGKYV